MKTVIIPRRNRFARCAKVFAPAVLLIAILLPACTHDGQLLAAQTPKLKPYALIVGTVWGPDDHPVYGVKVKIRRAKDKKPKWEMYSDHNGEFAQRVPAGESDYIVWADLKGFKTTDGQPLRLVQPVTIHIYNDERQDMGLHLTR